MNVHMNIELLLLPHYSIHLAVGAVSRLQKSVRTRCIQGQPLIAAILYA